MSLNVEEFTKQRIGEDGTYRAFPVARTVEKAPSGAVAIAWKLGILQRWHGKEAGWSDQFPYGWFTENRTWIVKKDGTLNDGAIKSLAACGLWDGDFDKLDDSFPVPQVLVLVDVEKEESAEYGVQFRANWINPDAPEPKPRGQFAPVDRGLLQSLRTKHQSKTRALAGGGAAAPVGAPLAPPGIPAAQAAPAAAVPNGAGGPPSFTPPTAFQPPVPSMPPRVPQAAPPAVPGAQGSFAPQPPAWGGGPPTAQTARPGGPTAMPPFGAPPGAPATPPVVPSADNPIDPGETPF